MDSTTPGVAWMRMAPLTVQMVDFMEPPFVFHPRPLRPCLGQGVALRVSRGDGLKAPNATWRMYFTSLALHKPRSLHLRAG